jgi:hypothetical protein
LHEKWSEGINDEKYNEKSAKCWGLNWNAQKNRESKVKSKNEWYKITK